MTLTKARIVLRLSTTIVQISDKSMKLWQRNLGYANTEALSRRVAVGVKVHIVARAPSRSTPAVLEIIDIFE